MSRLFVKNIGLVVAFAFIGLCVSAAAFANDGNPDGGQGTKQPANSRRPPEGERRTNAEARVALEEGCQDKRKLRHVNVEHAASPKRRPRRRIHFAVHETSPVISFGSSRNTRANYVVLTASKSIPKNVASKDFEIDSLEPLRRIGEASLESVHLRSPTFTPPHFFNHRKAIGFNLCVSAAGGDPGTYTGQFQFIGPGAIATAALTQSVQLKAKEWVFALILLGVTAVALVVLILTNIAHVGTAKKGEKVARGALVGLSIIAAVLAMLTAWSQNPTWGENLPLAIGALIATGFGAVGLGSTLTAAAARISPAPPNSSTSEVTPAPRQPNG